jgi:hypothetical protein
MQGNVAMALENSSAECISVLALCNFMWARVVESERVFGVCY